MVIAMHHLNIGRTMVVITIVILIVTVTVITTIFDLALALSTPLPKEEDFDPQTIPITGMALEIVTDTDEEMNLQPLGSTLTLFLYVTSTHSAIQLHVSSHYITSCGIPPLPPSSAAAVSLHVPLLHDHSHLPHHSPIN